MQLILLAAGMGNRLPKYLRKDPKCMVKINNKCVIEYLEEFTKKFKNKTIITGYKSYKLKEIIKKLNLNEIRNNHYKKTNMVYSMFRAKNILKKEIVICYTDIIFDPKIYLQLSKKKNQNIMPINKNWLNVWKGRMSKKMILKDAENLTVNNNYITSIGEKISKKLPKYQFMGIIKIKYKDYFKLKKYFLKLKNNRIDFTSFINKAIKNKIVKVKSSITTRYWYEIDNIKDKKFVEKSL